MSALERQTRSIFPDLFDWMDSPFNLWRGGGEQAMRVENYVEASYDKGILTVRAPMAKPAKSEAKRITIRT